VNIHLFIDIFLFFSFEKFKELIVTFIIRKFNIPIQLKINHMKHRIPGIYIPLLGAFFTDW